MSSASGGLNLFGKRFKNPKAFKLGIFSGRRSKFTRPIQCDRRDAAMQTGACTDGLADAAIPL